MAAVAASSHELLAVGPASAFGGAERFEDAGATPIGYAPGAGELEAINPVGHFVEGGADVTGFALVDARPARLDVSDSQTDRASAGEWKGDPSDPATWPVEQERRVKGAQFLPIATTDRAKATFIANEGEKKGLSARTKRAAVFAGLLLLEGLGLSGLIHEGVSAVQSATGGVGEGVIDMFNDPLALITAAAFVGGGIVRMNVEQNSPHDAHDSRGRRDSIRAMGGMAFLAGMIQVSKGQFVDGAITAALALPATLGFGLNGRIAKWLLAKYPAQK